MFPGAEGFRNNWMIPRELFGIWHSSDLDIIQAELNLPDILNNPNSDKDKKG